MYVNFTGKVKNERSNLAINPANQTSEHLTLNDVVVTSMRRDVVASTLI